MDGFPGGPPWIGRAAFGRFREQNMKKKNKKEEREPIAPLALWRGSEAERGMNPISVLRHAEADSVLNELTRL